MREGHASRTAQYNALFRALESALPEARRLFEDDLARTFLSAPLRLTVALAALPGLREFVPAYIDRRWPGARTCVVARTRLIDDTISSWVEGCEQFVVLGAGFDTRAYRLTELRDLSVYEVDHSRWLAEFAYRFDRRWRECEVFGLALRRVVHAERLPDHRWVAEAGG